MRSSRNRYQGDYYQGEGYWHVVGQESYETLNASPASGSPHTRVSSSVTAALPRPLDHDGRRDLNAFGGFPATPVHQVPSRPQANRFGGGAGDERLKLGDRDWRETSEPHLSELDHAFRLGQRLWGFAAVNHADGLSLHGPPLTRLFGP